MFIIIGIVVIIMISSHLRGALSLLGCGHGDDVVMWGCLRGVTLYRRSRQSGPLVTYDGTRGRPMVKNNLYLHHLRGNG
jgi:hypothetical protein